MEDSLKLEEIEVTGTRESAKNFDDRGVFSVIPRLVVEEGTRRTARHGAYGMVIRPVVEGDNGLYKLDTTRGRSHYTINSGLPKRRKANKIRVPNSRRFISTDTERNLRLPEGRYAISEVYYIVSRGPAGNVASLSVAGHISGNSIGNIFGSADVPEILRYCLSDTTLSFEIDAGETASFENLYLRGLPFRSRQWKDHDPIFGTDKDTTKSGQIDFTQDNEIEASWNPIAFDPDSGMCTDQSAVRTAGWDIPNPQEWNLPVKYTPETE